MNSPTLFSDPNFQAGEIAARLRQGEPVRVVSLWQPWAQLVALGVKTWETRSWSTRWRGLLAIHAARTTVGVRNLIYGRRTPEDRPSLRDLAALCDANFEKTPLPFGAVVALVQLQDVLSTGVSGEPAPTWIGNLSHADAICGHFGPERYGWKIQRVGVLERPLLFRASQGLKPAPASLALELAHVLRPLPQAQKEPTS